MIKFNTITTTGNLASDIRFYGKDNSVAEIVVYDSTRKETPVRHTAFLKDAALKSIAPKLVKGAFVAIEGHLAPKPSTKEKPDNNTDIIVDSIRFLNNPLKNRKPAEVPALKVEDDFEVVQETPEVLDEKPKRGRKKATK